MDGVSAILLTNDRPIEVFGRALASIVSQTHEVSEIIVVDTGDNVALSYEKENLLSRITGNCKHQYISTRPASNGGYGRNVGVAACTGEFISFLDDDDEWDEEKTKFQMAHMRPEVGIVHSDYYVEDEDGRLSLFSESDKPISNEILCGNYIGCTSMSLLRKKCFNDAGGFDGNFVSAQEWDLWVNMMDFCENVYANGCVGIKHHSADSITANRKKRRKGWFQFFSKHIRRYFKNIPCLEFAISTYVFEMFKKKCFFSAMIGISVKAGAIAFCIFSNKRLVRRS